MEVVRIPIDELDDSFQIRVQTKEEKVQQYAEYLDEHNGWGDFPPITVVEIDGKKMIADGIHRYNAAIQSGFEDVPCMVVHGDYWNLLEKSVEVNGVQGIDLGPKDWKKFRRMAMEALCNGLIENRTMTDMAKLGKCSIPTITNLRRDMESEGWTFPETAIGADGKERRTTFKPREDGTFKNLKVETPDYTLCPQCGTPIWPENKGSLDYTYTERSGQWFCSPECADQWEQERLSDEAEAMTGIPDELPDIPSAALQTHEEDEPEPVKHGAEPVLTEDDENRQIVEEIAELLKNFRPQRINNIIILLFNVLNLKVENIFKTRKKNILKGINAESYEKNPLSEEEKTGFVWKLNDGSDWELARPELETFKNLYPAIDVEQELRNSIGWNLANPKNRKTKTGILKHLTTWLGNAQNRAARQGAQRPAGRKSGYVSRDAGLDFENLEY